MLDFHWQITRIDSVRNGMSMVQHGGLFGMQKLRTPQRKL